MRLVKTRQVCFRLPMPMIEKMERIRELLNLPIGDQIKLLLAGYRIIRISNGEEVLGPNTLSVKAN